MDLLTVLLYVVRMIIGLFLFFGLPIYYIVIFNKEKIKLENFKTFDFVGRGIAFLISIMASLGSWLLFIHNPTDPVRIYIYLISELPLYSTMYYILFKDVLCLKTIDDINRKTLGVVILHLSLMAISFANFMFNVFNQ